MLDVGRDVTIGGSPRYNDGMEFLLCVVLGFAPGAFWLWFLHGKDDHEPEPWHLVILVFVLGAISIDLLAVLFGGVMGLRLVQVFDRMQQLDILTMLGFVILVGTVINNSILIVHHALQLMREGTDPRTAIKESVRVRVRPIFMSTATSVFGMLPLIIMPGAGSELYRGLGSVVVGGLAVSSVFTLFVTPLVFSYAIDAVRFLRKAIGLKDIAVAEQPVITESTQ